MQNIRLRWTPRHIYTRVTPLGCQPSGIMCESHACGLKISISRIKDNFSRLTHKSGQLVLKTYFHFRFVIYYFFAPYNNRKSFQISTIRLNRKCSKVVGHFQQCSEVFGKSSEVARTLSEIPIMTRQTSHAFDSEEVGRYIITSPDITLCKVA